MKQHYVPKLHLRNFTQAESRIIAYERNRKPYPVGISKVCAENDCYTVIDPKTGEPDVRLEKDFARIESAAARPLKKLIENDLPLSWDDIYHLSCYIAFLISRSPAWVEWTKKHHTWNGKKLQALCLEGDREGVIEFFSRWNIELEPRPEFGITTTEGMVDAVVELVLQGKMSFGEEEMGKSFWLNRTIGFGNKLVWLIYDKKYWQIGHPVAGEKHFITSDNPAVILDTWFIGKTPTRNIGLVQGILCLPITPDTVLFLHNEPMVLLEHLNNSLIDHLNYLQMFYSYKRVLSQHSNKAIKEALDAVPEGAGQRLLLQSIEKDFKD